MSTKDTGENEILAEARARAEAAARVAADKAGVRRKTWQLGALGLGAAIGSAAVAGAVLYARRRGESDKG